MRRPALLLLVLVAAFACGRTSGPIEVPPEELPFDLARLESPTVAPDATRGYAVFFVHGDLLVKEERELDPAPSVAAGLMRVLLEGPNAEDRSAGVVTEIPNGVTLLGVSVADGVARVDLSGEFQKPAPPERVVLRVAQVVWTLTALAAVSSVAFSIDGDPVAVATSDGTAVERRVSRQDYVELAPAG